MIPQQINLRNQMTYYIDKGWSEDMIEHAILLGDIRLLDYLDVPDDEWSYYKLEHINLLNRLGLDVAPYLELLQTGESFFYIIGLFESFTYGHIEGIRTMGPKINLGTLPPKIKPYAKYLQTIKMKYHQDVTFNEMEMGDRFEDVTVKRKDITRFDINLFQAYNIFVKIKSQTKGYAFKSVNGKTFQNESEWYDALYGPLTFE